MYADKLLEMISQIGQPLVSKSTQQMTRNEPLDISSLMMMLLFSDLFKKPEQVPTREQTPLAPHAIHLAPFSQLLSEPTPAGAMGLMPGAGGPGGLTPQMLFQLMGMLGGR